MKLSLETSHLSKIYGKTQALNGLTLKVEQGSIYGLIGPNGAGKTTSLAILAGLIQPTSGKAWVLEQEVRPGSKELAAQTGFSSPQFPLLDYLSGREILSTCGLMHKLSPGEVRKRMADLLDLMDLSSAADQYVCHYSHGMKQKLSLACALIHSPEVCLMDEPFLGLDPVSVYRLTHVLDQMAVTGRSIIISSHDITLVERLCNKVGILNNGVLQREITLAPVRTNRMATQPQMRPPTELESALWDVAGTPEIKTLAWI